MRASSLPLLLKCPGSLSIPCEETKSEEAERGAAWGNIAHTWKATGKIECGDKRTSTAFKKALELSGIDRHALWPPGGYHENSVAVRVTGGDHAEWNTDGAYTGKDGWLTGTADFHWTLIDGRLWVDDLKTGKCYPNPAEFDSRGLPDRRHDPELLEGENRYPQKAKTEQTLLYALGICLLLEYKGPVDLSVTHWPRLPLERRHSPPERMWAQTDWTELSKFYDACRKLERDRLANNTSLTILTPGSHCRFCPARANCMAAEESTQNG